MAAILRSATNRTLILRAHRRIHSSSNTYRNIISRLGFYIASGYLVNFISIFVRITDDNVRHGKYYVNLIRRCRTGSRFLRFFVFTFIWRGRAGGFSREGFSVVDEKAPDFLVINVPCTRRTKCSF